MNMKDAAARLEGIIKRLGGGTSTNDEGELRALLADMKAGAGESAPKQRQRKQRATATTRKPAPAPEKVAKAKTAAKGKAK